ncbi:MAG: hypothetical protein PHE79_09595 [Eubacteriales bacterium]|nr:hypothetical protein [Eubacteriales bacterium]
MEDHLQLDSYQLDEAQFKEQYHKTRGHYPSDEIILIYSSIVEMAHTAYIDGSKGRPFRLPFPIKKT